MEQNYKGPGRYRHYKGGEYEVLGLGRSEFLGRPLRTGLGDPILDVVYRMFEPDPMSLFDFWLRPLDDFNAQVRIESELGAANDLFVPRFEKIDDIPDFIARLRSGVELQGRSGIAPFVLYSEGDVFTFRNLERGIERKMVVKSIDSETGALQIEPEEGI